SIEFYCNDDSIDVFPVAFVDQFFSTGGLPHLNLANTCNEKDNGVFSGTSLAQCQFLAAGIKTCQSKGKIVTLSLGGATGGGSFGSDAQAVAFADTIWNLFLGGSSSTRPFGDAVLDGVDLDIESGSNNYTPFVNRLREKFAGASKKYYITAAPQCVYPDAALSSTLNNAHFDAIYVQFYNNPCGLGNFNNPAQWNYGIWDYWARNISPNKNVKVYIGAPASSTAAGSGYVTLDTLKSIAQTTRSSFPSFGGIMFWDASQAYSEWDTFDLLVQADNQYLFTVNGRLDASTKSFLKAGGSCGGGFVFPACKSPAWSASGNYPAGSKVSYQGYEWVAKWYASGPPVGNDDSNTWRAVSACSGSSGSTLPGTTTSTKPVTTTTSRPSTTTTTRPATSTTTSTPSGGSCSGVAAWNSATAYSAGNRVTYNGRLWEAAWWSYNETPGGSSGAWVDKGACTAKISAISVEQKASIPKETAKSQAAAANKEKRTIRFGRENN
ncbi:Chitinase 1, partial [Tulasnella sp. 418]